MKTCFLSIDVEKREEDKSFEGVENLYNLLNIFKKHNVNATLFVTGEVLEKYPDLVKRWSENFEIACHNYNHAMLDSVEIASREKQLKDFVVLYENVLKARPNGFRAPRNVIDNEQFPLLKAYSFKYDSSVFSRYPWPIRKYDGYKGRAPILPYYPSKKNYLKKGKLDILEIPESPITFFGFPVLNLPVVATWIRKWGVWVYKLIFFFLRPRYISFNMHSWDGVEFEGKSCINSGKYYLNQLDQMIKLLLKKGYTFKTGKQIYEEFSKNR